MVDTKHLVLNQEDLVVEVAHHQLEEVVQLNQELQTQVGHNMDIVVARVETTTGQAAEAAVPVVMEVTLTPAIVVVLVVLEEVSLKSLQHLVLVVIFVAVLAVVETRPRVVMDLVHLVVVDEDVVMKTPLTRLIQMRLMERLNPVVAVVEIEMLVVVEMVEVVLSSLEFLILIYN